VWSPAVRTTVTMLCGSSTTLVRVGNSVIIHQPTCLVTDVPSDQPLLIGSAAYDLVGKQTQSVRAHFPVEAGAWQSYRLGELYLRLLAKQTFQKRENEKLESSLQGWTDVGSKQANVLRSLGLREKVLIIVSNTASQVQRKSVRHMAASAGWGKVELVESGHALAAAARAHHPELPQLITTLSVGGQRAQIAVVVADEIVAAHDIRWGTVYLAEAIQRAVSEDLGGSIGWSVAQQLVREFLSFLPDSNAPEQKYSVRAKSHKTQIGETLTIDASVMKKVVESQWQLLVQELELFLASLTPELAAQVFEHPVFVAGSGARMRGLVARLQQQLGWQIMVSARPDLDEIGYVEK
jgi:rod shape-determining protein MreB